MNGTLLVKVVYIGGRSIFAKNGTPKFCDFCQLEENVAFPRLKGKITAREDGKAEYTCLFHFATERME